MLHRQALRPCAQEAHVGFGQLAAQHGNLQCHLQRQLLFTCLLLDHQRREHLLQVLLIQAANVQVAALRHNV